MNFGDGGGVGAAVSGRVHPLQENVATCPSSPMIPAAAAAATAKALPDDRVGGANAPSSADPDSPSEEGSTPPRIPSTIPENNTIPSM